ncbi:MAG: flp pilus-assembly TadE/G-like family protein, partial [Actinobacteria bacterium]|nr:flp pilus-assembly TadE/G-like family protein [Actinomycetota bacterium]
MTAPSRWKPRSPSPPSWWCSSCAQRGCRRCRCRSAASTRPARRRGWRPGATARRQAGPRWPSPPRVRSYDCAATADSWWRRCPRAHRCCRGSPSPPKRWRRWNPPRDDSGSATLLGVAVIAVLLTVTAGMAVVGSAVIARHRAQAAADLAALAAAQGLAAGEALGCGEAARVAAAMRTEVLACTVDGLDVTVTVGADVDLRGWGITAAR